MQTVSRASGARRLLSLVWCVGVAPAAWPQEAPPGAPQQGLTATIATDQKTYTTRDPIHISMTLTNVSARAILIDPWEGNWFVQVYDDAFNPFQASRRAQAARRPMVDPMTLQPGQSWTTTIEGLKLFTRLPEPFVLWAYRPLVPGTYWLGAECWALPDPSHPESWSGLVRSELTRMAITEQPTPHAAPAPAATTSE